MMHFTIKVFTPTNIETRNQVDLVQAFKVGGSRIWKRRPWRGWENSRNNEGDIGHADEHDVGPDVSDGKK